MDPQVVVRGGAPSLMPRLYERVPAPWSRWVFGVCQCYPLGTVLRPSRHGDISGLRGAARPWLWNDTRR